MIERIVPVFIVIFGLTLATRWGGGRWRLPVRGFAYKQAFIDAEKKYSLPENILARMAYQESRFRPEIIDGTLKSSAGAVGIMQIIPRWHPGVDPYEPFGSIDYAGRYMRDLFNKFGSWRLALAAYNWGPGNVQRKGFAAAPTETQNYVNQITTDIGLV